MDDKQMLIGQDSGPSDSGECRHPYNPTSTVVVELCQRPMTNHGINYTIPRLPSINIRPVEFFSFAISRLRTCRGSLRINFRKFKKSLKTRMFRLKFHQRALVTSLFTVISSSACLILFPAHLENLTKFHTSDSYSACFAITTLSVVLYLVAYVVFKCALYHKNYENFLSPEISWQSILKIGFSIGISLLTLFYSWEDHKVLCNFQDSLLGLVIIFAIITHSISKWQDMDLRKIFSLSTIAAGVFVSVDYSLVDQNRCRGYNYHHVPMDTWSWKVHLVWTMAFVCSIWLWTVSIFFIETAIPISKNAHKRLYDTDHNNIQLRVIRIKSEGEETRDAENAEDNSSLGNPVRYRSDPYTSVSYLTVLNSTLWLSISTWVVVAFLSWTEFIPGFGRGATLNIFPKILHHGFQKSIVSPASMALVVSVFVFSQSFVYLLLLLKSPIVSIAISCLAFPVIGLWWSWLQPEYSAFPMLPIVTGELICSLISFPIILIGIYYLYNIEILQPNQFPKANRIAAV